MKKLLCVLALLPVTFAATGSSRSIWDGVFSAEQVARGKKSYEAQCADCHGDQLQGDGKKATPLKGELFSKNWLNKSVHRLIDTTRRTMPPEEPMTLSAALCTDVVAYILSENGYPPGKADLAANAPDLRHLMIEPPRK